MSYRTQIKFQKIISYFLLVAAALVFIYSLCLITDVYSTTQWADGLLVDFGIEIDGLDLYVVMQDYNRNVLTISLVLLVLAASLFAFNTHSRRKYYFSNYLTSIIISIANVATAAYLVMNINKYKPLYLAIDFEELLYWAEFWKKNVSISTFWFDFGYVLAGILILVSVLAIVNLVWKTKMMKAEARAIKEGLEG